MQRGVMGRIGRLMPQQIAVRPGVKQTLIAFPASFTQRQRDGAIRKLPLDGAEQIAENLVGKPGIFTALQNEGAKSKRPAFPAAEQNLIRAQTVALCAAIAATNAAIETVVFAPTADLNETAGVDRVSIYGLPKRDGAFLKRPCAIGAALNDQRLIVRL